METKYCKRCGRAILPMLINWKDNKPIIKDVSIEGDNNERFCGYCASSCFFINGNMYSMEEALNLIKLKKISPPKAKAMGIRNGRTI